MATITIDFENAWDWTKPKKEWPVLPTPLYLEMMVSETVEYKGVTYNRNEGPFFFFNEAKEDGGE